MALGVAEAPEVAALVEAPAAVVPEAAVVDCLTVRRKKSVICV